MVLVAYVLVGLEVLVAHVLVGLEGIQQNAVMRQTVHCASHSSSRQMEVKSTQHMEVTLEVTLLLVFR